MVKEAAHLSDNEAPNFSYLWGDISEPAQVNLLHRLSNKDPAFFHSLAAQLSYRSILLGVFVTTFGQLADTTIEQLSEYDLDRMLNALKILEVGHVDMSYLSSKVQLLKNLSTCSRKTRLKVLEDSEAHLLRQKYDVES